MPPSTALPLGSYRRIRRVGRDRIDPTESFRSETTRSDWSRPVRPVLWGLISRWLSHGSPSGSHRHSMFFSRRWCLRLPGLLVVVFVCSDCLLSFLFLFRGTPSYMARMLTGSGWPSCSTASYGDFSYRELVSLSNEGRTSYLRVRQWRPRMALRKRTSPHFPRRSLEIRSIPTDFSKEDKNDSDSDDSDVEEPLWIRSGGTGVTRPSASSASGSASVAATGPVGPDPRNASQAKRETESSLWRQAVRESEVRALDFEQLGEEEILREAQRLAAKQEVERISKASYKELLQQSEATEPDHKMSVKDMVDKILIADFFLITLGLVWFLTGILQQSISKDDALLMSWLKLWDPLFQPAIGVFMGAAAISAISSWLSKRT